MHEQAQRPTPQLGRHRLPLITPLSSFYPPGPYPNVFITSTSLPYILPLLLPGASCQRPEKQLFPHPTLGRWGSHMAKAKTLKPIWAAGRKPRVVGGSSRRAFVFPAAPAKPDPSRGLRK